MPSAVRTEDRRIARAARLALCGGLVVVVGSLDYLTGSEIGFSIFYLIPVAIGTWLLGPRAGMLLSGLSALAWWIDDALLGERVYSNAAIPLWNATMRFGVFVLISGMLARLQTALSTERRSMRQLAEAYADLDRDRKEQLASKDRLLSYVSHELRTPLTAIHQFVTIPLDGLAGPLTETQRECMETALRNVNQLTELIGDLLDSARVDSGKLSIEPQVVSLHEIAGETLLSLGVTAKQKKIRLVERIPRDLPEVWADPSRVRQVLYNLVGNALKFTPERGSVTVEAAVVPEDPGVARVTVSDTGRGISEAAMRTLFERLFQEERQSDAGRQGLGLGLFLSREIVVRHGGRIWAESAVGRGSRFSFTLPFVDTDRLHHAGPVAATQETAR